MTISCEDGTASLAGFELAEGFHPEKVCLMTDRWHTTERRAACR